MRLKQFVPISMACPQVKRDEFIHHTHSRCALPILLRLAESVIFLRNQLKMYLGKPTLLTPFSLLIWFGSFMTSS